MADWNSTSRTLRTIFEDLIWPAVAGNVLWSASHLIFDALANPAMILSIAPRFIVLLGFAIYLTTEWLRLRGIDTNTVISRRYWAFETPHLLLLTLSAIAAHIEPPFASMDATTLLALGLASLFLVTGLGHAFAAWDPYPKIRGSALGGQVALAVLNALGGLILGVMVYINRLEAIIPTALFEWILPGLLILAYVIWRIVRRL